MTCSEVHQLSGAYLDSELDAKTTGEVQQHLLVCVDCARAFAADARLDAQVLAGLTSGQRSVALWEHIEAQVMSAAPPAARAGPPATISQPVVWWRELLWPCPQAWAGLAAVWVLVVAVNFATPESKPGFEARRVTPPSPQMRQVLKEQKQMLAELGELPEKLETNHSKRSSPQPRSQRREHLLNT